MATTGQRADADLDAGRLASRLREAEFVHLVGRADGAGLAAVGLLASALDDEEIPLQASLAMSPDGAHAQFVDEGTTVGIGFDEGEMAIPAGNRSLSLSAYEIAAEFDAEADAILAIAGALAESAAPTGSALEAAQERGVERRPGLGIPVVDLAAGLAYSGRVHASFSGDEQAAGAFLAELGLPAELDASDRTQLASAVALEATENRSNNGAQGIATFLAPYDAPSPFETIEGYADVLDALTMADPGTGLAYVLGYEDREVALDYWRTFGKRLHRTVGGLSPTTSESVTVASVEAIDPRPVVRLLRDFTEVEPIVIVGGQELTAVATTEPEANSLLEDAFDAGTVAGDEDLAWIAKPDAAEEVADRLEDET